MRRAAVAPARDPLRGSLPLEFGFDDLVFFSAISGKPKTNVIARGDVRARVLRFEGSGKDRTPRVKLAGMHSITTRRFSISAKALLSIALLAASSLSAVDRVEFTIFARVRFSVPGDWPVIASKSDKNRTIFAFQVPNSADQNTPDSTNLTVQSFYLNDAESKAVFEKKSAKQDPSTQEQKLVADWECSNFQARQKSTAYEGWDCHRTVEEVGVYVRVAWPHLPKNPRDYDQQMQTTLADVLAGVAPSPK